MSPQANSRVITDRPAWPEPDAAEGSEVLRITAAARSQRPRAPAPAPPVAEPRTRLGAALRIGQVGCWQAALTLFGLTAGRPWPVAGPGVAVAAIVVALTGLRVRHRWLYEWAGCYARFRTRARDRHLPREDGPRAVLHLLAPDAAVTAIGLGDGETAVVSRACGAAAVLRVGGDPVEAPPRLGLLGGEPSVQLVLHGVAGGRRHPLGWLAVHLPRLSEEDELPRSFGDAVRHVLDQLAEHGVAVTGLDRAELLGTVASLAHAGGGRGEVRERWRSWCCGPVAQAGFRLHGWAALPDPGFRELLRELLTATTGAVVTVALAATGPGPETALMRVAASGVERLESSAACLGALAARYGVRLDRMDGEHAGGVAATLPLGGPR